MSYDAESQEAEHKREVRYSLERIATALEAISESLEGDREVHLSRESATRLVIALKELK